jgi:hypothetical protein
MLLAQDSLYVPNLSYRTGPFAATGTPLMNGQKDYMTLLNERDGGINGVRIDYDECETGYNTERGMECYEATRANAIVTQPWSTGITLQVLPRTNVDEIPVLAPGYGFSPMADGKTFKWAFNPPSSYWDGASMLLNFVADGDLSSLDGKKIVLLHLDAPYGREPIPLLRRTTPGIRLHPAADPGRGDGDAEPVGAVAADPPREPGLRVHVGLGRDECGRHHRGGPHALSRWTSSSASGGRVMTAIWRRQAKRPPATAPSRGTRRCRMRRSCRRSAST